MTGDEFARSKWGDEARAAGSEGRVRSSLPAWMERVRNRGLVEQAGRLWDYITGNRASAGDKVLVLAALLYLISPWDLVPDFLAVAGWLDDVAVASFVLALLQRKLSDTEAKEAMAQEILDPAAMPQVSLALPKDGARAVEYRLDRLREAAGAAGVSAFGTEIDDIAVRVDRPFHLVAFVGRFNTGKSSLINLLLDRDLLPVGPVPTTAAITFISHGLTETLCSQDEAGAATVHADMEGLKRLRETMPSATTVSVFVPAKILDGGICFVDSPGLEDPDLERARLTLQVVPEADVLVMVLDAGVPLSRAEHEFIGELLSKDRERKLFFVLNKTDSLEPGQLKDLVHGVEASLQTLGIEPRVYPVSATTGDGLDVFREDLLRFLKGGAATMERNRYIEARIDILQRRLADAFRARLDLAQRSAADRKKAVTEMRRAARERKERTEEKARQLDAECERVERRFAINFSRFFDDVEQGLQKMIDDSGLEELKAPNMFADRVRRETLAYLEKELAVIHEEIGKTAGQMAYDLETEIAALALPVKAAPNPRVPIKPDRVPLAIMVLSYPFVGMLHWLYIAAGTVLGREAIEKLFSHVMAERQLSQARAFLKGQIARLIHEYRDQAQGKVSEHFRHLKDAMRREMTGSVEMAGAGDFGDGPLSGEEVAAAQAWLTKLELPGPVPGRI